MVALTELLQPVPLAPDGRTPQVSHTGRCRRRGALYQYAGYPGAGLRIAQAAGVALCGLGELSTQQIAPALQKTEYCRLAGVITGSPGKVEGWTRKYDIPPSSVYTYDTMQRMADNPAIDVVYVVSPNALHLDHAVAAAKAGKHVFCEKPLEVSVERGQRMIDAVKNANCKLGVAYRCRFEPNHLECMRIAREKEFGALKVIDAYFGFTIGPSVWRLSRDLAGGGPLMDIGVYALQATRYLTGEEPIWVSATVTAGDPARFLRSKSPCCGKAGSPAGRSASVAPVTIRRRRGTCTRFPSTAGLVWIRRSITRATMACAVTDGR